MASTLADDFLAAHASLRVVSARLRGAAEADWLDAAVGDLAATTEEEE